MSQRSRGTRVGAYAWIEHAGKILLVRQALGPNTGKWSLAGGGLEFGENPREALCRELQEECGLHISVEQSVLLEALSAQTVWQLDSGIVEDLHWVGLIFSVEVDDTEAAAIHFMGDGESADESKWFSKNEIDYEEISPLIRAWMKKFLS